MDYEKIAASIPDPERDKPLPPPPAEGAPALDPVEAQRLERVYLPASHPKYQGIATDKGYKQGEDFSGHRLQRVKYSHEAMIDVLLAEPSITQRELARRFDRSENWLSIVMGSDAFQAALAKRRDDVTDPFLIATIEERFRGLAQQSLQVIAEKLEVTKSADLALKALDISAKALGFGARTPTTGPVTNFVVQLPPQIADAGQWASAHDPAKRVIDAK